MGETIEQMKKQLNDFWEGLDRRKKIKLGISSILIILSITTVVYFTTRTEYEVLYSNLTLEDAGTITKKLEEMGVSWKNGEDETTILVPKDLKKKIKIELATEGLPKEGYSYIDAFNDTSWTMTDYEKKERLKYALQNELASTISEIEGIDEATIYIDIPDDTSFILNNSERKPKASVFLKLSGGMPLSSEKVLAVRNLVAGAIKGMEAEDVTITDDSGNLLSDTKDEIFEGYDLTEQIKIQQTLQGRINDSIKRFLENIYGQGNVDVRANVKINFDSEVTNIVQFSPPIEGSEEGLIRSMEQLEENTMNGSTGGVPGIDSNTNDITDYVEATNESSRYSKASKIINYELNEINKQIRKAPGQIESVTVAILINQDSLVDGAITDEDKKEIAELIYAATGLDTKQVKVNTQKFNNDEQNYIADSVEQEDYNRWFNPISLIAILAFIAIGATGFMIYRNRKKKYDINEVLKEVSVESQPIKELDIDLEKGKSEVMTQIVKFVEKKPDQVAQLLRTWLNEE